MAFRIGSYYFKAVGSDEYWQDKDGREYDKKEEQAISKLTQSGQTNSEQAGAGQPVTRSESKSDGDENPNPESEGRSR